MREKELPLQREPQQQALVPHHHPALQHRVQQDASRARHLDQPRQQIQLGVERERQPRVLETVDPERATARRPGLPHRRDLRERHVLLAVAQKLFGDVVQLVPLEPRVRVLDREQRVHAAAPRDQDLRALALARLRALVLRLPQPQQRAAQAAQPAVKVVDGRGQQGRFVPLARRQPPRRPIGPRSDAAQRGRAVVQVRKVKVEDVVAREDVGVKRRDRVRKAAQQLLLVVKRQHVRVVVDRVALAQAQQHRLYLLFLVRETHTNNLKVKRDLDHGVHRRLRKHAAAPRGLDVKRQQPQRGHRRRVLPEHPQPRQRHVPLVHTIRAPLFFYFVVVFFCL